MANKIVIAHCQASLSLANKRSLKAIISFRLNQAIPLLVARDVPFQSRNAKVNAIS